MRDESTPPPAGRPGHPGDRDGPGTGGGPGGNQYFDPAPTSASKPRTITLDLPDGSVSLRTDAGVFSADRIDPGTRTLLLEAPVPSGDVAELLDVGCGYGPIAVTLARRAPDARVWAVDVNPRARALCAANAEALGLTNVVVAAPADVDPAVRFDGIWSNPPIRIGKKALHALLQRWLHRLGPRGHAYLVVHKHLGSDSLQRWLTDQVGPAERLASRAGYRVLDVRSGRDAGRSADPTEVAEPIRTDGPGETAQPTGSAGPTETAGPQATAAAEPGDAP